MKTEVLRRSLRSIGLPVAAVAVLGVNETQADDDPPRLRRAESFFGLHFDLHARADDMEIGKTLTEEMIQNLIDAVQPDYLQCDGKGHEGFSSYPTQVGNQAGGFVKDPLRIWRDVTARNGVALYVHYSGLGDDQAVKMNPEWSLIDADGSISTQRPYGLVSYFGPYVDELMIPQLKELNDKYDVDGVWVDAECWAAYHDYSAHALNAWKEQTGYDDAPRKAGDEHWAEYAEFCRQGFRDYFAHYVNEMRAHNPRFQIAGNWAYSTFMPEPVTADVDFISGDMTMRDSVNAARFQGRYLAEQGMTWDLMAWSFRWGASPLYAKSTKSAAQLQQEAAVVLALGGGFQLYFKQNRDLSISEWQIPLMKEVADFCRARQPYCYKAELVPQVALLFSRAALYHSGEKLFGQWRNQQHPAEGVLQCLLDGQNAVQVVSEHHLIDGGAARFPVIVVPEWNYLEPSFIEVLKQYAQNGGQLIVIGYGAVRMFESELGVDLRGGPLQREEWFIDHGNRLGGLDTRYQPVSVLDDTTVWAHVYAENNYKGPSVPLVTVRSYGKGRVAGIYTELGRQYKLAPASVPRAMMRDLIHEMMGTPLVQIQGTEYVDVIPARKDGKLMVNLVNTAGPHQGVAIYDSIPTLGPFTVHVKHDKPPVSVRLQPGNHPVEYRFANGVIQCEIDRLEIHNILVIE